MRRTLFVFPRDLLLATWGSASVRAANTEGSRILARKLRRYINAYSADARPIQWKYSDPSRRILSNDFSATRH